MVKEAIGWPKGPSQTNRKTQKLYYIGNYYIGVEKPGKEAAVDYKRCTDYLTKEKTNNPNDMLPVIYFNNSKNEKNFNFMEIFQGIELLMHSDLIALEVLGMVLFRIAFVLDHKKDNEGSYRLNVSPTVMDFLKKRIPDVLGVSVEAFIYYLETLALNEDVKYFTLHNNPELKLDAGRVNTLSTLVNLIAVLINRKSLAEFAGNFARLPVGIAPIQKTKISDYFPLFVSEV
ncbi:MAG: hypothetical protein HYU48_00275 [Candidatus Levybacteria bacterium]|nr:hypothetical protein [Candidatus Levybacteria bacterium]